MLKKNAKIFCRCVVSINSFKIFYRRCLNFLSLALARDVEPNDERVPLLEVIVFPTKLQGQVFISAVNPCFSAPTADDLKNKNHILALAFNENNLYLVEPSQFDANEYIANAEREAAQKIAMLEQDEIERMKNGG